MMSSLYPEAKGNAQGSHDPYFLARKPVLPCRVGFTGSGRSAVWLARLFRVQEVGGSNPLAPTPVSIARRYHRLPRTFSRDQWLSALALGTAVRPQDKTETRTILTFDFQLNL